MIPIEQGSKLVRHAVCWRLIAFLALFTPVVLASAQDPYELLSKRLSALEMKVSQLEIFHAKERLEELKTAKEAKSPARSQPPKARPTEQDEIDGRVSSLEKRIAKLEGYHARATPEDIEDPESSELKRFVAELNQGKFGAASGREQRLLLRRLQGRVQGLEQQNLAILELLQGERDRYFKWFKGPQAKIARGETPTMAELDKMISTYAAWGVLFRENVTWLKKQAESISEEVTFAEMTVWNQSLEVEAKAAMEALKNFLENLEEVVQERTEGAEECEAESKKFSLYKNQLYGK